MENNTYYTCKCIYFDIGYITCKICAQWVKDTSKVDPKVEPVFAKRWTCNLDNNKNQKIIAC